MRHAMFFTLTVFDIIAENFSLINQLINKNYSDFQIATKHYENTYFLLDIIKSHTAMEMILFSDICQYVQDVFQRIAMVYKPITNLEVLKKPNVTVRHLCLDVFRGKKIMNKNIFVYIVLVHTFLKNKYHLLKRW